MRRRKNCLKRKKTGDLKLLSKDSNETENNKGEYIGSYKKKLDVLMISKIFLKLKDIILSLLV